jgi:quaternary ammonium compound-resistance protein SugE
LASPHPCANLEAELNPLPDEARRTRISTTVPEERIAVAWIVLVVSGVLEAVWATALGKSEGFSRLGPTVIFGVGLAASMAGLAYALRTVPVGTGYAVWVGIGAVLTVSYAMVFNGEAACAYKLLMLAGIVGCVVGLKVLH